MAIMFTREQRQKAYKRLPEDVREFVMSEETGALISSCLTEAGLSHDYATSADREILDALLGLQSLDRTIENIKTLNGVDPTKIDVLKSNLEKQIFSSFVNFGIDINNFIAEDTEPRSSSNLPEIAPVNLPMAEKGEEMTLKTAPEIPKQETTLAEDVVAQPSRPEPPAPAPTPQTALAPAPVQTKTNSYGGRDPYREPIE